MVWFKAEGLMDEVDSFIVGLFTVAKEILSIIFEIIKTFAKVIFEVSKKTIHTLLNMKKM